MATTGTALLTDFRHIYPLNRLSPTALAQLASGLSVVDFPADHSLFDIGETPKHYYYLLSGQIDLLDAQLSVFMSINAELASEQAPLPQVVPSLHAGHITAPSRVLQVDRNLLDTVLKSDLPASAQAIELGYAQSPQPSSWREAFLLAQGYARIGRDRLNQLFKDLQPIKVRAGEILISYGDSPDYFYILAEGRCEILRKFEGMHEQVRVTEYGPGATVGEDGLISNSPRNATVRMITDGLVMRLDREAFNTLLKPALAISISYNEAVSMVAQGARWLDVRLPNEVQGQRLPGSLYIPHPVVRTRLFSADPGSKYIVVCKSKRDSPVIAYMLSKYGYDAHYLEDGFDTIPVDSLV